MGFHASKFIFGKQIVIQPTTVALLPTPYEDGALAPVTDDPENPVYVRKGGVWIPISGVGGGGVVTFEALTFPVDYNDVTAAVVPVGTVFTRQAEIDAFLVAEGATNFKHLQACWDSMPNIVAHDVNFNLAAGIHRPLNPTVGDSYATGAFVLMKKKFAGVRTVNINGALPAQYTQLVVSTAITGVGTGASGPYADFTGTPFTGLNLRGYYVVFNTGQCGLIHKHTASRLYVIDPISPSPASAFVGKPSTILRNSYNDTTPADPARLFMLGANNEDFWPGPAFSDLSFETFGVNWTIQLSSGCPYFVRTLIDLANEKDQFGVNSSNTRPITNWWYNMVLAFTAYQMSIRGPVFSVVPQLGGLAVYWGWVVGTPYFTSSYIAGMRAVAVFTKSELFLANCVFDECSTAVYLESGAQLSLPVPGTSIATTFRGCGTGLHFGPDSSLHTNDAYYTSPFQFEQNTGSCVRVDDGANAGNSITPLRAENGPAGGNAGVGIELLGVNARVVIDSSTSVTGTLGDVRMADGDILSYADILAKGPYTDVNGNIVKKTS